MRFTLLMELKDKNFPIDYRKVILSYIKNALANVENGKFISKFYKNTIQKEFCFTVELPNPVFQKDKIVLEDKNITIKFSTSDNKTGFFLQNIFMSQIDVIFKIPTDNSMTLKKIIRENKDLTIKSSKVVFKTSRGNGLCLREHNRENNKDIYITYKNDNFQTKFGEIVKTQALNAGFSNSIAENIKFTPLKCKKVLVKHYGVYIDTTVGFFELEGDSRLLQYLYDGGVGSRKSSGFGMLEIVNQI